MTTTNHPDPTPPASPAAVSAPLRPVEELQALCDAATAGPWIVASPVAHVAEVHTIGDLQVTVCTTTGTNWAGVDAAFIAAARTALPSLLARLRAAEETLAAVGALFAGGPDTACRTVWQDGIECVSVPLADLRVALAEGASR